MNSATFKGYKLLLTGFVLLGLTQLQAQRKSELFARIDTLQTQLSEAEAEINRAQQREKASLARAESYEAQVDELKAANATLLNNLNSFAQVSNKNNNALNQALASLEAREAELRNIVDTFSRNDSLIIALLTDAKSTLGPEANLKVGAGSLVISGTLDDLFGSDTGEELTEAAGPWLEGIASLAAAHPDLGLSVEGLSMTGDLSLAARQATSVMNALRDSHGLEPARMSALGRDGNFSEGINILVHPDYKRFYNTVRSEMKR